jgi:hypothetical protein
MYEGIKTNKKIALLFNSILLVRRLVFGISLILSSIYVGQLYVLLVSSFGVVVYEIKFKPYDSDWLKVH